MKSKILIQFAHPNLSQSRINQAMLNGIRDVPDIVLVELYERYPDFYIDVPLEQELLKNAELLILHFPMYNYGAPSILKEWIDVVLEYGFAYGGGGQEALWEKNFMIAVTTGGPAQSFQRDGFNRHTLEEFLCPFQQTAALCGMRYWPPFVVHGTHQLTDDQVAKHAAVYRDFLLMIIKNEGADPRVSGAQP